MCDADRGIEGRYPGSPEKGIWNCRRREASGAGPMVCIPVRQHDGSIATVARNCVERRGLGVRVCAATQIVEKGYRSMPDESIRAALTDVEYVPATGVDLGEYRPELIWLRVRP